MAPMMKFASDWETHLPHQQIIENPDWFFEKLVIVCEIENYK